MPRRFISSSIRGVLENKVLESCHFRSTFSLAGAQVANLAHVEGHLPGTSGFVPAGDPRTHKVHALPTYNDARRVFETLPGTKSVVTIVQTGIVRGSTVSGYLDSPFGSGRNVSSGTY